MNILNKFFQDFWKTQAHSVVIRSNRVIQHLKKKQNKKNKKTNNNKKKQKKVLIKDNSGLI